MTRLTVAGGTNCVNLLRNSVYTSFTRSPNGGYTGLIRAEPGVWFACVNSSPSFRWAALSGPQKRLRLRQGNFEKTVQTYPRGSSPRYRRIRGHAGCHPRLSHWHDTPGRLEREQCLFQRRQCASVIELEQGAPGARLSVNGEVNRSCLTLHLLVADEDRVHLPAVWPQFWRCPT
jgi:hypothetical protein